MGGGPALVDLGSTEVTAISTVLDNITTSYDNKKNYWKDVPTVTNFSELKGGYIVTKDKNNAFWIVLGIASNQNVWLGIDNINNGDEAIRKASAETNLDPRKLVFNGDSNGALKIAWSGRAATSGTGDDTPVIPYTKYDKDYSHILLGLLGDNKTFGVTADYKVKHFASTVIQVETNGCTGIKPSEANGISFIYETTAVSGGRRAWFWWGSGDRFFRIKGQDTTVMKGLGIRFGRGKNDNDYPSVSAGLTATYSKDLKTKNGTPTNNSNPPGKVIFTRHADLGNEEKVNFFTTIVAYNIRMTDSTANDTLINSKEITGVREGIMEFDDTSFTDAQDDGFTHLTDAPKSNINDKDPIDGKGNTTEKIPFVFFKPKAK